MRGIAGIGDKVWNDSLAMTVGAIGTTGFAPALIEALTHVSPFNYSVIFAYCNSAPPLDLFDTFPPAKRRVFVDDYQAGPYLLDPVFIAKPEAWGPGPHRVADLAPDRFPQSQYFRSYYVQTGLSEEIAFFAPINRETRVVISLMRDAARLPPFAARERKRLSSVAPLVAAASVQNWKDIEGRFSGRARGRKIEETERILASAFRRFGEGRLTGREGRRVMRAKAVPSFPTLVRNIPVYQIVPDEAIELIHDESLKILEEIGCEFRDAEAIALWKEAGADVRETRVRIDRVMLMELIGKIPSQFVQHARNPDRSVTIGGKNTVVVSITNCNSPLVWDATMLDALKVYSAHNQPCILAPFALCGASTSASAVGAVAQVNAEALAGLAFTQLVRPGSPQLYGQF